MMVRKQRRSKRVRISEAAKPRQPFGPTHTWRYSDPNVRAELRREARLIAQHPENDAIDAFIEVAYDWSEWR
jgi:hypothetical protein